MATSVMATATSILIYGVVVPIALALATVASTWLFTNIRYQIAIRLNRGGPGVTRSPVKIPYALPFFGSAISYITSKNGSFWDRLFQWHPRATGACTLKMGGRDMHVLYDPRAVQGIFKAREPSKHTFNVEVLVKAFGIEHSEVLRYYGFDEQGSEKYSGRTTVGQLEHIHVQYVIKPDRVNELTRKFVEHLRQQLASELQDGRQSMEVGLYAWMRNHIFTASVIAFFGQTLLEDYPDLGQDFAYFDQNLLTCFFGIPRWISPKIYDVRDKASVNLTKWQERNHERSKGHITDPDGDVDWDPVQGSRAQRARMQYFESRGLNLRSQALFDFGLLFGLNSNAIPTAGWMLMHILDPRGDPTLYPRVMSEIAASKNADGSGTGTFNIATLVTQPLLQSILHEVLRLYNDTTVTRDLLKDLTLPVGDPSRDEKLLLRKGSIVVAASWIVHRDAEVWSSPPAHVFHAERFLTADPSTPGRSVFDPTVGAGSRLFPWGGGKSICPGRTFAKQEMLGSVAMMLDQFDLQALGYLDGDGKDTDTFPDILYGYPGPAMVPPGGDLKVRISRR